MEDELTNLINRYKLGDTNSFIEIHNKMKPLLVKYANNLCFEDFDDMYSELTLALLECIDNVQFYDNEYQILHFINQAIINKFHELYRISQKQIGRVSIEDNILEKQYIHTDYSDEFSDLILKRDLFSYISTLPDNKKKFAYSILIEELTDIEIGKKYHVTRQYVHRLRKFFYTQLLSEFL